MALKPDAFLKDLAAQHLRSTCLMGIYAYSELLQGDVSNLTVGVVMDVNATLVEQGIFANMNVVPETEPNWQDKRIEMIHTPLRIAEYVGGQLVGHWARVGLPTATSIAHLQEHDISYGNAGRGVYMLDPEAAPDQAMDVGVRLGFCGTMAYFLGE